MFSMVIGNLPGHFHHVRFSNVQVKMASTILEPSLGLFHSAISTAKPVRIQAEFCMVTAMEWTLVSVFSGITVGNLAWLRRTRPGDLTSAIAFSRRHFRAVGFMDRPHRI
jgi:hypothetical protein